MIIAIVSKKSITQAKRTTIYALVLQKSQVIAGSTDSLSAIVNMTRIKLV